MAGYALAVPLSKMVPRDKRSYLAACAALLARLAAAQARLAALAGEQDRELRTDLIEMETQVGRMSDLCSGLLAEKFVPKYTTEGQQK